MSGWTPERIAEVNAEMADAVLVEIREMLVSFGMEMTHTPPMFYPEAIRMAIQAAYLRGKNGDPLGPKRPDEPQQA